jgi:hypothetical protein
MKRLSMRVDYSSVIAVVAMVLAIASSFPFEAFSFKAANFPAREAGAAFVELTHEEEAAALKAARTSWQVDHLDEQWQRVDCHTGDLPADPISAVVNVESRLRHSFSKPESFPLPPYRPSMAAPRPDFKVRKQFTEKPNPAFGKEEFLKID